MSLISFWYSRPRPSISFCRAAKVSRVDRLSLMTSVRWVVMTLSGSTTVYPFATASSWREGSIHLACRPKVGSRVGSPAMSGTAPPVGSMASRCLGRTSPFAASTPMMLMT